MSSLIVEDEAQDINDGRLVESGVENECDIFEGSDYLSRYIL